jgi:hypothetical protein
MAARTSSVASRAFVLSESQALLVELQRFADCLGAFSKELPAL